MSRFFIVLILVAVPFSSKAQQTGADWTRGLRVGCDLSRFALPFIQKGRKAIEFSADTELKPNIFPTIEVGFDHDKTDKAQIQYKSDGIFGRIGVDKNYLKNSNPAFQDAFTLGLRYGYANLKQTVLSYTVSDPLWGDRNGSLAPVSMGAHWFEVVTGVKAQILKNFFLGFSMSGRFMIYSTKAINYPDIWPGFGNGANKANFGFHYTLSYRIPMMRVKGKPSEKAGKN